jgi:hypothetical protein
VRVFSCRSLQFVLTLPRPHHLGVDVALGKDSRSGSKLEKHCHSFYFITFFSITERIFKFFLFHSRLVAPPYNARFPDTVAASLDVSSQTLACVYNDHSLYVWDVQDVRRIGKFRSSLFHSAGIWDIEVGERRNSYFQFSFGSSTHNCKWK